MVNIRSVDSLRSLLTWADDDDAYCFDCMTWVKFNSDLDDFNPCNCSRET